MLRRKSKQNNKIKTGSFSSKNIPIRENGDNYFYVENFEQTNEKECKEFDKFNQIIYEKYLKIYKRITKQLDDCPFKLDKEPEPPRSPNNYESLIKWRSMNISKNVSHQTICLVYLLSQGIYNISMDFNKEGILPSDIIKKAEQKSNNDIELMKQEGYKFLNKMKNKVFVKSFSGSNIQNNQYQQQHKHITVKNTKSRSKNKVNVNKSPVLRNYSSSELTLRKQRPQQTHTNIIINNKSVGRRKRSEYKSESDSFNSDRSDNQIDYGFGGNYMMCQNPEHHSVTKKINHFDNKNINKIYPNIEENNPNFLKPSAPPPPEYHTNI